MAINQKQFGFSTIELLIASAILVIVFSAVVMLVLGSQKLATSTQTAHSAELINQKLLEGARANALTNFNNNNFSTILGTNPEGLYTKSLTASYVSPCVKNFIATVAWSMEGRQLSVTTSTQVTNPSMVFATGAECNTSPPPGGSAAWNLCTEYRDVDLPSSNYDAYDVAVSRINGNRYLFMVGHPSNQNNPEDFWIYNINDIDNPTFVNKLDANGDNQKGLNAIVVVKQGSNYYAYVAGDDNKNQLIAINVTDPVNLGAPTILNISGFGTNVVPKAMEYINNTIYLAIDNTIQVINVITPTAPSISSVITLSNNISVNKLAINGNYLFAATSDNNAELVRISLANYATRASYNAPGNEDGTAVYVTGGTAYLGRTQNTRDLDVVDVSGATLSSLGSKNLNHQNNSSVVEILVSGPLAFVASGDSNREFEVYDISNPNTIVAKCIDGLDNPPNIGFGMTYFDNYVFMAMRSNSELSIFADHH